MPLDEMTRRNLELVESLRGGSEQLNGRADRERSGTLLGVLDRTLTPMGARMLRQWILAPLLDRAAIDARLDAVGALQGTRGHATALREALDGVRDVERLGGKAAAGRATPRELGGLRRFARAPAGRGSGAASGGPCWNAAGDRRQWDTCSEIVAEISQHLVERPPLAIGSGGDEGGPKRSAPASIASSMSCARCATAARTRSRRSRRRSDARTGIASLKVGYNKVFGYFIEVTNANQHLVPADYQRRQTLTGAERYVTPALKEYEERVLTAAERIEQRERELFETAARARWRPRSRACKRLRARSRARRACSRSPRWRRAKATCDPR